MEDEKKYGEEVEAFLCKKMTEEPRVVEVFRVNSQFDRFVVLLLSKIVKWCASPSRHNHLLQLFYLIFCPLVISSLLSSHFIFWYCDTYYAYIFNICSKSRIYPPMF